MKERQQATESNREGIDGGGGNKNTEESSEGSGVLLYTGERDGLDCFQDRTIPCRACARCHQRLDGWMLEDRARDSLDWTHVKEQIFFRPGRNGT